MAKMNEKIRKMFQGLVTVVLATADKNGAPNAVPVNAKAALDDETIVISDQFFNKTLANVKENPQVSVSFWEGMNGYQLKGKARIVTEGPVYETMAAAVKAKGEERGIVLRSKGVLVIKIDDIFYTTPGPKAGQRVE